MTGAIIGVCLIVAGVILYYARKGGKDAAKADAAEAGKRIADAEKNAVRTVDDIADRLRNGGKL